MAEATLNAPMKNSNSKKRKNEQSQFAKVKKVMLMPQQNSDASGEHNQTSTDISTTCSVVANKPYRKNYHIGGKKYAIFYGERDLIDHIQIKEWDGKVVLKEGVKLNRSRFVMILHNVEIINHTLEKILKGEEGLNSRIHIGGSYYLSVNSPYKTVAIRMWRKGGNGEYFPTKSGITMSCGEWDEFTKISNKIYSERMEIFTHIPCLMQSDQPGHNKVFCAECCESTKAPMGEVDFDIPL